MKMQRSKRFSGPTPKQMGATDHDSISRNRTYVIHTGKVATACEAVSHIVAKAGAEMINVVLMDGGKGLMIARNSSQAAMTCNHEAFGALVIEGVVDPSSILSRSGDTVFSF